MYKIAIVPGDGTGTEVIREAVKVLDVVAQKHKFTCEKTNYDLGGERYLKTGDLLPESVMKELSGMNAILLGAVGHPGVKPGILEHGILLKLRFALELYINLRPVKLFPGVDCPLKDKGPKDIDFVIIRENNECVYIGAGGSIYKGTNNEVAIQEMVYTWRGVERCLRYAFEFTRKRNLRKKLTLCAKTNVIQAHELWQRVYNDIAKEYPDITQDYAHVDATCMWMVKNPEAFDVIVTPNMFGDIITDLGAIIQGGMGIAAGGNINPKGVSMFEPIGGSAPKYAGQNIINPLAAICAAQMMLEYLGETKAARDIENAVAWVTLEKVRNLGAGKMGYGTSQVGDLVIEHIRKN
mgnify:CR=1 FL=1